MTTTSFNLIDEPWIPVLYTDGTSGDVSIKSLFEQSHRIKDITPETDSMRFSLYRLLLQIVNRAFDSQLNYFERDTDLANALLESDGQGEVLGGILSYLQAHHDRFDLMHPTHPFMQVAELRTAKDEWKSLEILVPDFRKDDSPFGNITGEIQLTPAEAARYLVFTNAYDISGIKSGAVGDDRVKGGKGYPMGVGWSGYIGGIIITASTLWRTLVFNYLPGFNAKHSLPEGYESLPLWEHEPLTARERKSPMVGPVSLMTWPQRRIRLRFEHGMCVAALVANGDPSELVEYCHLDPHTSLRFDKYSSKPGNLIYKPQKLSESQALWQGLHTFLPTPSRDAPDQKTAEKFNIEQMHKPAPVLEWVAKLREQEIITGGEILEISIVSMVYGVQMAKFENEISDRLALHAEMLKLEDNGLLTMAKNAVTRATQTGLAVRYYAKELLLASGASPASDDVTARATEAETKFFQALDTYFRSWILGLNEKSNANEELQNITEIIRETANAIAKELISLASPDAWGGRTHTINKVEQTFSVGKAESLFRWKVRKALPKPTEPQSPSSSD